MKGSTNTLSGIYRSLALIVAFASTLALSGCNLPFIGQVDIPFLDTIKAPEVNLSNLPNLPNLPNLSEVNLPIGVSTSVEEARAELLKSSNAELAAPTIHTDGVLTVGIKAYSSSAPLCIADTDGSIYGLEVDIASALADELGLAVAFVPVSDIASGLGACDVVMNVKASESSEATVVGPYAETATVFFHRGDARVLSPTDLNGKSVGLQGGSVSENLLSRTDLKMNLIASDSLNDAFDALTAGQVEYVLCDAYPGAYLATMYSGISFAGSLETPVVQGVAIKTANAELIAKVQKAMETIQADGTLEVIRSRWVGNMPTLTAESVIQGVTIS